MPHGSGESVIGIVRNLQPKAGMREFSSPVGKPVLAVCDLLQNPFFLLWRYCTRSLSEN